MTEVDLGDDRADITEHDTFVTGVPYATFDRLRREEPVSWWEENDGRGFWALTRYQDVIAASRQPEIFSSAMGIRLEDMDEEEEAARRTLMEMDPPEHTRYRRLVSRAFTRKSVLAYEDAIRALARRLVDDVHGTPEIDFTDVIARQLPMRMLGRLLGLPSEDSEWLVKRGDALIANSDPDFTDYVVDQVDTSEYRLLPFRSPVAVELIGYGREAFEARRSHPSEDLLTALLAPMPDGERLTDAELANFFCLLVAAGNDTTRYSMVASMKALAERPALLSALADEPGRLEVAVEEMLRWASVTMHFRRTATQDTELGGKQIRAGDKVLLWFVSANYDPAQFPEPYHFDAERRPNDHVTFGLKSPHLCLGAHLARMELRVVFEELLPRIASVEIAGPVERLRSNFIAGIKRLPLEITWK
ncbi:MAG: cytochrome P450 [Acidimicrobiales bacterium]